MVISKILPEGIGDGSAGAAPGGPGGEARWTSSAKSGVGTSMSAESELWFTLSHGIVNEVYYPRMDQANIRDLGLIVTNGTDFFSEEKRDADSVCTPAKEGVPCYRIVSTCKRGRYRLHKRVFSDPRRPCLLQHVHLEALVGAIGDYRLYALLAPHLSNQGAGNDGWRGDYKGFPMLFAKRDGASLAFACSQPFLESSCGFVGVNDGWTDLKANRKLTLSYANARGGNIALTARIDLDASRGGCVLALAFGRNAIEAGEVARASLLDSFGDLSEEYEAGWEAYQKRCLRLGMCTEGKTNFYRVSTAVLKTHQSKHFVGGMIASLSIPWGFNAGDNDLGGYHLVWPRDLAESAGALLACGDSAGALDALRYLLSTQEADGHWPQNMWLDGRSYWKGIQLDETAFPILLADSLFRQGALRSVDPWPEVRLAASFIAMNGPVTLQDRWEEDGGFSPFTLGVVIAALLAAADFADRAGEGALARYLRETADLWNDQIERWTYVTGTPLAARHRVEGYYVRIADAGVADSEPTDQDPVQIKNRPAEGAELPAAAVVSPDFLALVRFGLRAPDDPRILATVKVVDALLRADTATGPIWHRYNDDGYGEHDDGSPFDGTGVGRGWPLLAGERAHYELAAGNFSEADGLRRTMELQAGKGGFFPEQVWDAPDIPERELFNGRPSGSAMPLVWAHAEYVKLVRSLSDRKVFDMPPQTHKRYVTDRVNSPFFPWRFGQRARTFPQGKQLRIETLAACRVHWSFDGWRTVHDKDSTESGLGVHVVDLPTAALLRSTNVAFTFFWPQAGRWEGADFSIQVA
jgi:glucoamylase